MYLIGDRQMMTVDSSEHVKFTSDKTTYRVIQRNDGRPWVESALTPTNKSATLSPFVQLAARCRRTGPPPPGGGPSSDPAVAPWASTVPKEPPQARSHGPRGGGEDG